MKIGIFTNNYLPNSYGVTISIESFRKEFEALGHEVYIFAPKWKEYEDSNPNVFRYPSVSTEIKFKFPLAIPYSFKIRKILKKLNLDIIHSQHPNLLGSAAFRWAKKKKIPLVFTWHTLYDHYTNFVPFLPGKFSAGWIIGKAAQYANASDLVIAPTGSIVSRLRDWGVTGKIISLPTGIDEKEFENPDRNPIREKYGIEKDEALLLLVSRLTEEKNIRFILESLASVLKENQKIKLMFAGEGYLIPDLKNFAEKRGIEDKIIFTGMIDRKEIKNYYAAGDVFVHASKSETQGLSVTEAMYMGLPVVAVKATGVSSLVMNNLNGFLVGETPAEFSETIFRLSNDPTKRKELGENAGKVAHENYTSEVCAKRMLEVYENLIKG